MNPIRRQNSPTRVISFFAALTLMVSVLIFGSPATQVSATPSSSPTILDLAYTGTKTVTLWFEAPAGVDRLKFTITGACTSPNTYEFTSMTSPHTFDLTGAGCDIAAKTAAFTTTWDTFSINFFASDDNGATWSPGEAAGLQSFRWDPRAPRAPQISNVTSRHQGCRISYSIVPNSPAVAITAFESTAPGFGASSITQYRGAAQVTSPIDLVVSSGFVDGIRRIRAKTAEGYLGLWSKPIQCTATPATAPVNPTVVVTPASGQLAVNWSTTSDGGTWPYRVEYSTNGTTYSPLCGGTVVCAQQNSFNITGLTNGTNYSVSIRVFNTYTATQTPNYVQSNSVSASPCACTVSGAPSITSLTSSSGTLNVNFAAPTNSGGQPVTNYEYSTDGGSTWVTRSPAATTSPLEVTGLTNGQSYDVQLRAVTSIGSGAATATSTASPNAAPTVTAITPSSGDVAGLQNVSITGTGFRAGATVSIGGSTACTGVTVVSSTSITCTTSASSAVTGVSVRVTNSDSQYGELANAYSYTTTTTTTTAPRAPSSSSNVSVSAGAVPNLVTSANQAALEATPGSAVAVINGQAVAVETVKVQENASAAAQQAVAKEIVAEITRLLPTGATNNIKVVKTTEGAELSGLMVNPEDPNEKLNVPVDSVTLVKAGNAAVLISALNQTNLPAEVSGGVIEVTRGGIVSARAYGLPGSQTGEIVLMSTPRLLKTFTVAADGSYNGQVPLPTDIAFGSHTVVMATANAKVSLGINLVRTKMQFRIKRTISTNIFKNRAGVKKAGGKVTVTGSGRCKATLTKVKMSAKAGPCYVTVKQAAKGKYPAVNYRFTVQVVKKLIKKKK